MILTPRKGSNIFVNSVISHCFISAILFDMLSISKGEVYLPSFFYILNESISSIYPESILYTQSNPPRNFPYNLMPSYL